MNNTITLGEKAPEFTGKNQNDEIISLSDYLGKKVILFFYPKDSTPGCTAEACNLRDNYELLQHHGFEIIGISTDSVASHYKFATKQILPFSLISDEDKRIVTSYQVWGLKKFMGKEYMGTNRTTFIIDEQGNVAHIINKVATKDHANQILELGI